MIRAIASLNIKRPGGSRTPVSELVSASLEYSPEIIPTAIVSGYATAHPSIVGWTINAATIEDGSGLSEAVAAAKAGERLSVEFRLGDGYELSGDAYVASIGRGGSVGSRFETNISLLGAGALTSLLEGEHSLPAQRGTFLVAGQDAGLIVTRVYRLDAESGSITLTGQDADLVFGFVLTAESGSFTLTGQDATFETTRGLVADSGTFALTGQDADLKISRLTAEQGSFTLSGQDADLVYDDIQPSTGSEVTTLLASDITGKSDGETLIATDWPDTSAAGASISVTSTLTYRASGGNLGGPAVEFDDSGSLRVQSFGDIDVGDSYVTLFVMRTTAVAAHLDELQRADATNTDIVHYYDFGGADDWQVYNGGSPADIHFAAGDTFFSSFGLMKITNDRTSGSTVVHEGSTLGTGEMTSDQITGFRICVSMDMMVEAFVILKNPSAQDVTDWENYLVNAYGVTA